MVSPRMCVCVCVSVDVSMRYVINEGDRSNPLTHSLAG